MIVSMDVLTDNFVRRAINCPRVFECEISRRRVALVYFSRKSSSALITRTFVACERSIVNKRMAIFYAAMGNQCARRANPHAKWIYSNRSRVPGGEDRYKLRCLARRGVDCYTTCSLPVILPTYYSYRVKRCARPECNCEGESKTEGTFAISCAIGCHFFANRTAKCAGSFTFRFAFAILREASCSNNAMFVQLRAIVARNANPSFKYLIKSRRSCR